MVPRSKPQHAPVVGSGRCIAPIDDMPEEGLDNVRLCGAQATTTRLIENLVCALCEEHAREIDDEPVELPS